MAGRVVGYDARQGENAMKYGLPFVLMLLLFSACGGGGGSRTYEDDDDDHYTQDDLDKETEGVYRPSNSGEDDDGVEKGDREKPAGEGDATVEKPAQPKEAPKGEPKKETPRKEDPKTPPATVEQPKKEEPRKEEPRKEEPKKEEPKKEEPKKEEPRANDRMDLITAFIGDVSRRMDSLEDSKLWKDFLRAKETFDDRVDKGMEKRNNDQGKDAEEAWANAIKAWYEVRYMYELLLHMNWKAAKDFEPGIGLNFTELQAYSDAELRSADCAQTKAAHELAEQEMTEVRQFQTDVLKYDLVASKVYVDPKQEKKWSSEKQKWKDATEGKFDEKDLKKYR
jgi:hypothetical protein